MRKPLGLFVAGVCLIAVVWVSADSSMAPPAVLTGTSTNGPAVAFRSTDTLLLAWTDAGNLQLNFAQRTGAGWRKTVTSSETSPSAPALAFFNGRYYVAWRGAASSHQLNVMSSADGVTWNKKVTLNEASLSGPALASYQGRLYLAWRGVSSNQLNVMSSANGTTFSGKVTLAQTSRSAPALTSISGALVIAWRGADDRLNVMKSANATTFTRMVTLKEATQARPGIAGAGGGLILVWQGVGTNLITTIASLDGGATWSSKTTTSQASYDGPAIGLFATGVIAWTGTDRQHHLNVAGLQ